MTSRKKDLLLLVDSHRYIRENCYQHQLLATLERFFRVRMISMREIALFPLAKPRNYDVVLSSLKLRTLDRHLDRIARYVGSVPIHVYEQDVWQAYLDGSPTKGAYSRIATRLNVVDFLVTSNWWAEFVRKDKLPCKFVRIGLLPQYCDAGPSWDERSIPVAFQGTLHPHRAAFFEALSKRGIEVTKLPSVPYQEFLRSLHRVRIRVNNESQAFVVGGNALPRNALWHATVEAAGRGTFVIRDYEPEAEAFDLSDVPTVITYRSVDDVPAIIELIQRGMTSSEREEIRVSAVEAVRKRDDWTSVVHALGE
jgi:hypothetical protein